MVELTKETFRSAVSGESLTVVDFWAPWCGPCRMMAPILESAALDLPDVQFAKLNVDENEELAREYGIMSIPTLIFFKGGAEIARSVGSLGKPQLLARIAEVK